jgi:hypothetical protein
VAATGDGRRDSDGVGGDGRGGRDGSVDRCRRLKSGSRCGVGQGCCGCETAPGARRQDHRRPRARRSLRSPVIGAAGTSSVAGLAAPIDWPGTAPAKPAMPPGGASWSAVLFAAAGWDGGLSARGKQILPSLSAQGQGDCAGVLSGGNCSGFNSVPLPGRWCGDRSVRAGAIGSADWSWPDIRGEAGGHPRGLG